MKVYNFSAGPSTLPHEVLEKAQKELLSYNNSGISIMEASHRGNLYSPIHSECISLLRELFKVPDNYEILLLQGGASTQFEAIPLNLLKKGRADYIVTGVWAKKALAQAERYGDCISAASSEDKNFTYVPKLKSDDFRKDIDYVHYTSNNTIYGTHFNYVPETDATLVCDMSSDILSQEVDVSKFGLIYAGAQKNISCAGVTIVIVRKDLIGNEMDICPTMYKYSTHAGKIYNTPPCFPIYIATLSLRWLKAQGGIPAIQKINQEKAKILYDLIDNSKFYINNVNKEDRSLMNVIFTTPSKELDAEFVSEASKVGIMTVKGHRATGGMRASIYNAMTLEGVKYLAEFMKKFELEHK